MKLASRLQGENGAGTVLAIALVGAALFALAIGQIAFNYTFTRLHNQQLADEIAIATADSLRGLSGGYPCEVATSLANRNKVTLDECRVSGFDVFIRIHSDSLGTAVEAKAKAGPS